MSTFKRDELIKSAWDVHDQIEKEYLKNLASKKDDLYLEKQRLLLADMAIHLLQTSLDPNPINLERLKDNLYSILHISDQFLENTDLKSVAEKMEKDLTNLK